MARKPKLGQLRHRIVVTNWVETPDDDINLIRTRPKLLEAWARIVERRFIQSQSTVGFDNYQSDTGLVPSHEFQLRNPSDFLITKRHWLYVERRHNRREWYRIMATGYIDDREDYIKLDARLHEIYDGRADEAVLKTEDSPEEPIRDEPPTAAKSPAMRTFKGGCAW